MARSKEEIISEMVDSGLFSDQEIKDAANKASETPIDTGKAIPKEGIGTKIANTVAKAAGLGLDAVNAPFELAGEAGRMAVESNNPGDFRAPSIVQKLMPSTQTAEPPMNPLSLVNKLLRAGAGAIAGLPDGNPIATARAAYNAPRGTMGTVEDTAMGLLLGKAAPEVLAAPMDAATVGAEKVASGAMNMAKGAVKKGIRVALGPTEEAQSVLANRPQDVARQTNFTDLGDRLAETTNNLAKGVNDLDNQAWDTLLKLKAEPQSKLIDILKSVKKEFVGTGKTKIGDADRQAASQIDSYIERIKDIKQPGATPGTEQFLDQPQLKEIIQSVQKDARYDLPDTDPTNRAVQAVRAKFDSYLKEQNPGYEDAMKPVAEATSALKDTIKRFRLDHKPDQGYLPTGTTVSKLTSLVKEKNPEVSRTIEQLKNTTGVDFADEAKLTSIKQQFDPGVQRTSGSRRTVAGGAIGGGAGTYLAHSLGLPPSVTAGAGAAAGASAGAAADYYGGSMAKSIIDMLSKGRTGVGNVLAAVNAKTEGTPLQDVVKRLLQGQPAMAPLLREANQ